MASGHNTDAELNTLQLQVLLLHKGPLGRVTGYAAKKFLGMRGDRFRHSQVQILAPQPASAVSAAFWEPACRIFPVAEESSCFREVQPLPAALEHIPNKVGRVGTRLCPACNISTAFRRAPLSRQSGLLANVRDGEADVGSTSRRHETRVTVGWYLSNCQYEEAQ